MFLAFILVLPAAAAAAEPAALVMARTLYNSGSYDEAIDAATTVRKDPKAGDAAALVIARAHLERFRIGSQAADLAAARETLRGINTAVLSARDQLDLLIGLGQTLFLDQLFGAAADLFDTAFGRASILEARDREKLLDWWATALDREAQSRPADKRVPVFGRIAQRMEDELRSEPGSAIANYWLVVAARGATDLDGAWAAAIAGWVRAGLAPDSGAELRADLDKLVNEALIPERSRGGRGGRDQQEAAAALRQEWEDVKAAWR